MDRRGSHFKETQGGGGGVGVCLVLSGEISGPDVNTETGKKERTAKLKSAKLLPTCNLITKRNGREAVDVECMRPLKAGSKFEFQPYHELGFWMNFKWIFGK